MANDVATRIRLNRVARKAGGYHGSASWLMLDVHFPASWEFQPTAKKKAMIAKKTKKGKRIPAWTALHFSLANVEGRGQGNVPHLLNRLAAEIRSLGEVEVLDITFQT